MTADTAQTSGTPADQATAAAPTPEPAAAKPIPLDTFCRDRSLSQGRQVEILAGFHHSERRAGRLMDLAASYEERFQVFMGAKPKVDPLAGQITKRPAKK